MATKTINQKITISGGDEIARTLRDLARLGEQAFKQLGEAASKIDLNLPIDKVKQQLVELGQSGQQAFAQLAQAAQSSVSSINQAGAASTQASQEVAQLGTAAQKTAQDVAAIGPAAQSIGNIPQQAEAASSALSNIGTAVKVVGVTLGGLAATFSGLAIAATAMGKSASDSVIAIGRAADAAKVSVENFSRAGTLLQQFGLTSDQSAAAIKRLGELTKTAFDGARAAMQQAGDTGGQTVTALQRALQGTEQTLAQIARTGGTAAAKFAQGAKVIVNEVALQNEQTRAKFAAQMASMADITINGKRIFDEATAAILKYAGSFNEVTGAARRPTEVLTELADRLQKIPDAAQRANVLNTIFGKELGAVLLPALNRGTAAFVNMIGTIDRLNLKTTEAERKVGQDFRAAWDLLQAVIAKNNQEIGLLIAKPLTPFINRFAEAMRRSAETFKIYEAAVNAVMPVIGKFLDEIAKIGKVDATFPETLKRGVEEFGNAVGAIFTNVIIPAFNGLKQLATDVAGTLTRLFSTNVTPAMVALGAALVALLGPINAIGVALVAIFSGEGPGFDAFREKLKRFGIDIDAIKAKLIELVQDIGFLFSGQEHLIKNEWLLDLKDALVQFKNEIGPAVTAGAALLALLVRYVGPANLARAAVVQLTGILGFLVSAAQLTAFTFISLFYGTKILVAIFGALAAASAPVAAVLGAIGVAALLVATNLDTLLAAFAGIQALTAGNLDRAQKAFEQMGVGAKQASAGVQQLRQDLEKNPNMSGWERAISFTVGFIKKEWELFARDIEQFLNQLEQIAAAIAGVIDTIANAITRGLKSAFDTVVEAFRSTINIIIESGQNLGNAIAQPFINAVDTIKGRWDALLAYISGIIDRIIEKAKSLVGLGGGSKPAEAGMTPQQFVDEGLPDFEGQIEDRRGEFGSFQDMVGHAANAKEAIFLVFRKMGDQIQEDLESLQDVQVFEPLVEQAKDVSERISAELAKVTAENPFDDLRVQAGLAVFGVNQAFAGLTEAMVAPFQTALDQIGPIVEQIKAKIAEISQAIAQLGSGGAPAAAEAPGAGGGAPGEDEGKAPTSGLGGIGQQLVAGLEAALAQIQSMVQTAIQNIAAALAQIAIADPFQPLVQQAQNAVNFIVQIFAQLGQAVIAPFQSMQSFAAEAMGGISQVVSSGFDSMLQVIQSVASQIDGIVQQIISMLQAAVAEAERLASAAQAAASAASSAGGGSGNFFGGYTGDGGTHKVAGVVHGGEYVQPARVVRQPGVRAFMETLRRVGDLRKAIRYFTKGGGFSLGGYVNDLSSRMSGALLPGYAAGGLVPQAANTKPRNLGVLRLDVGGERLSVMADEATAFKLQRLARRQAMTSGGRAPVWER